MISEFDQFPVFYISNHNTMFADGEEIKLMPDHFVQLDFELEFAIVIGKGGRNILSKDALMFKQNSFSRFQSLEYLVLFGRLKKICSACVQILSIVYDDTLKWLRLLNNERHHPPIL